MGVQKLRVTNTARYNRTQRKANKPLLPGDASILRDIEKQQRESRGQKQPREPLEVTGQLRNFTPLKTVPNLRRAGSAAIDVCEVIASLQERMWTELPRNARNDGYALPARLVAEVSEFRRETPPAATVAQLYGVFPQAATLVDQAISRETRAGTVRLIPIQSKESSSLDLVVSGEWFCRQLDAVSAPFAQLCRARPDAAWFDVQELHEHGIDIPAVLQRGFLRLDPTRSAASHAVGIPNQGLFLKLDRQARAFLLRTIKLGNHKFHELPETAIEDRLVTPKRYWSELKGVSLEWILYGAIGGGWIDGFETPIGRGWKLL